MAVPAQKLESFLPGMGQNGLPGETGCNCFLQTRQFTQSRCFLSLHLPLMQSAVTHRTLGMAWRDIFLLIKYLLYHYVNHTHHVRTPVLAAYD